MVLISCRRISPTTLRHASGSRQSSKLTHWQRPVRLLHSCFRSTRQSRVPNRHRMDHRRCHQAEALVVLSKQLFWWDSQNRFFELSKTFTYFSEIIFNYFNKPRIDYKNCCCTKVVRASKRERESSGNHFLEPGLDVFWEISTNFLSLVALTLFQLAYRNSSSSYSTTEHIHLITGLHLHADSFIGRTCGGTITFCRHQVDS